MKSGDYKLFKQDAIEYLGGKCAVCGSTENLEFHHIDPSTKLYTITRHWSLPIDNHIEELNKCELLCYTHHKEKHESQHGSRRKYINGCRCDKCRTEWNTYQKNYRKNKKITALDSCGKDT